MEALRTQRTARRRSFLERAGWSLVVEAPGAPLFPQGFDPLNVEIPQPGEVLHRRWLRLRNEAGTVEVLGHEALTHAAGDHPLFNGVLRLTVTGLPTEPSVTEEDGVVTVHVEGISAEVRGARVEREGQGTTIRLLPAG